MKKNILTALFCITLFLVCVQTAPLEARHHRHSHVQVGIRSGANAPASQTTVVRHYAAPVAVPVYQPVYYTPGYASPGYMASEYMYVAPAPTYEYVEEVYTVQQRPRPFSFAGLSFSWNFFR